MVISAPAARANALLTDQAEEVTCVTDLVITAFLRITGSLLQRCSH